MKTQPKALISVRFPHKRQKEPVADEVINKYLPFGAFCRAESHSIETTALVAIRKKSISRHRTLIVSEVSRSGRD
jgi:hypothetical protein